MIVIVHFVSRVGCLGEKLTYSDAAPLSVSNLVLYHYMALNKQAVYLGWALLLVFWC